jgi:mono/diheme cytochrome c family protein
MQFRRYKTFILALLSIAILLMLSFLTAAQEGEATAEATAEATTEATQEAESTAEAMQAIEVMSDEELVARGEYLAHMARCVSCHTPRLEEFLVEEPSIEQVVTLSLYSNDALDIENRYMAGGREFSQGAAGTLIAGNLTPDEETGIGLWTDEELEMNLRLGLRPDGTVMAPLMPYRSYAKWSAQDMQALIAYLRSIPAIENFVDDDSMFIHDLYEGDPAENFAALTYPESTPESAVDLGTYLVVDVMRCVGCHTPQDPETGRPDATRYLAGGGAFEGPWGTVYGGNITPHATTGIGAWTDEEIASVFREGVTISGRSLILMPWQDYSGISDTDLVAVIGYLRSVEAIENEVPLPAINEEFNQTANE